MWIFSYIFWRCGHFCCGSLVLEVIPDLRSIGVWRCDSPFSVSKQQNLRTFVSARIVTVKVVFTVDRGAKHQWILDLE